METSEVISNPLKLKQRLLFILVPVTTNSTTLICCSHLDPRFTQSIRPLPTLPTHKRPCRHSPSHIQCQMLRLMYCSAVMIINVSAPQTLVWTCTGASLNFQKETGEMFDYLHYRCKLTTQNGPSSSC